MTASITPIHPERTPGSMALQYAVIGWHVVPCWPIREGKCACGTACKSPGKHPVSHLAQMGQKSATTDPDIIAAWWKVMPDANIGVYLAPSGLCAIDIDPRNGGSESIETLESEHGEIYSDVLAYTGGGGEHRVFEAPTAGGLPGKLAPGVDVKLDGYIIVEPSNHPSGGSYQWEGSSDPLEGALASPLPDWIRGFQSGNLTGMQLDAPPGAGMQRRLLDDRDTLELEAALEQLEAHERDEWLEVGMALHRDVDHRQALDIWCKWSERSSKYDPDDQIRVWYSFRRNSLDNSLGLATIFHLSKEAVAKRNVVGQPGVEAISPDSRIAKGSKLADAIEARSESERRAFRTVEFIDDAGPKIEPFPIESLNRITAWITDNYETTHPRASQAVALALCCAMASRHYQSPFGDPCHLNFGVIVPSTTRGQWVTQALEQIIDQASCSDMVRANRFTSPPMLYGALFRSPAMVYCAEDWAEQLKFSRRQPSGTLEQVHSIMARRIAAGADLALDNWSELGFSKNDQYLAKTKPRIYSPAMTMVASLPGPSLSSVFQGSEIARGAVDSMLFVNATDARWIDRVSQAGSKLDDDLIEHIKKVRAYDPATPWFDPADALNALALGIPTPTVVRFDADLEAAERRFMDWQARTPLQAQGVVHGARRHLRRLCVAMAAWADPESPVVTDAILAWVDEFVQQCCATAVAEASVASLEDNVRPDAYDSLADAIYRAGAKGITKGQFSTISKLYRRLKPEQRDDLIATMIGDDQVFKRRIEGVRGERFVHRHYVKVTEGGSAPE